MLLPELMTALLILTHNFLVLPALWLGGILLYPFSGRIRRGWRLRLEARRNILALVPTSAESDKNWIWLHVASVGEFLMAQPYVLESRRRNPQLRVLCTYASDSLTDWLVSRPSPFDATYLLPWDSPAICDCLLRAYRPKVLVLLRYDFWPNMVFRSKRLGLGLLLMAARARPKLGALKRRLLKTYFQVCDRVFVTDAESLELLRAQFGALPQFQLAPQGPTPILEARRKEEEHQQAGSDRPVDTGTTDDRIDLILGSCYAHEIEDFFRAYDQMNPELRKKLRVCFAPHRLDERVFGLIERECAQRQLPLERFSKLGQKSTRAWTLVDTLGKLFGLYRGATLAWVGNPGTGVHNVLEPLTWGVPVIFTPPYANSPDALELKQRLGATVAEHDVPGTLASLITQAHPLSEQLRQQRDRGLAYYRESCERQTQTQTDFDAFLRTRMRGPS